MRTIYFILCIIVIGCIPDEQLSTNPSCNRYNIPFTTFYRCVINEREVCYISSYNKAISCIFLQ